MQRLVLDKCLLGLVALLPAEVHAQARSAPEGVSASDWASIGKAYAAERHAVDEVEGGHRAENLRQQWVTSFDGRGFSVRPNTGRWTWGLQLERYGFAGDERAVAAPIGVRAGGQRMAYDWDATLEEWYVNDTRGFEHGYTVHERPAQACAGEPGPLRFVLGVRGSLRTRVDPDGRGARFSDESGEAVVTYGGLVVVDATGRDLPARLELEARKLRLIVDERGARYPLTIDPVAQQAVLEASHSDFFDQFGDAVAISGDTAVVGAPLEGSGATGVNGDESDNSESRSGAAYVFVRDGSGWSQQAYLKASNAQDNDLFGASVGISDDTIVVGAIREDGSSTGADGDQADDSALDSGAAYVFVRNGTTWSQQAYLKASNTGSEDAFGHSVAVSGDTVVVGALFEDSSATGVDAQDDNLAFNSGAAYVFVRAGTSWTQQAYFKASNTDPFDGFGGSVGVDGDTVVVGAPLDASSATGVGGDQSDNSLVSAGAAYVFVRNGTSWSQQAYLKASNTDPLDSFGFSVAVSGDTVAVGAPNEFGGATGVQADQSDDSAPLSGAAYMFVRSGSIWSQQAYLKASNAERFDEFGYSVALAGDTAVVGAPKEESTATAVNGDQSDNSGASPGAAYVFVRSGTSWSQQAYLKSSSVSSRFGERVGVAGDTALSGTSIGNAAYVFAGLGTTCQQDLGSAGPGASTLSLCGTGLLPSQQSSLRLAGAPPAALAFLVASLPGGADVALGGGVLVSAANVLAGFPLVQMTDASGGLETLVPGSSSSLELVVQYATIDLASPGLLDISNAVLATFGT